MMEEKKANEQRKIISEGKKVNIAFGFS